MVQIERVSIFSSFSSDNESEASSPGVGDRWRGGSAYCGVPAGSPIRRQLIQLGMLPSRPTSSIPSSSSAANGGKHHSRSKTDSVAVANGYDLNDLMETAADSAKLVYFFQRVCQYS